jgi:ubiquinone/menaquinone biosynthesis C-methylase UbiE
MGGVMRQALSVDTLRGVYGRIAGFYDFEHGLITARSDQRGRKMVVRETVAPGDRVLDCGAGTGSTALLSAARVGPEGRVTLFDLSPEMLAVAKERAGRAGLADRMVYEPGDMAHLPFDDGAFDAAVSTYSLCPVVDPAKAAREIYRVVRPGGRIGVAHSVDSRNPWLRKLGGWVEGVAWHLHWLSMGCRSVSVQPALEEAGGRLIFERRIGVPLWPFLVFVVEKPA